MSISATTKVSAATNRADELAHLLARRLEETQSDRRYLLGIVGYPGAGKSTVAESLVERVNELLPERPAIVVPMDGYHLSNDVLNERGLIALKGIPATFDSHAFVDLLRRLKTHSNGEVFCPRFDRAIEASIADAIVIEPKHRLCIVEGNYLLLDDEPWDQCRLWLDEVWFLDVSFETITPRLLKRHIEGGKTEDGARSKVESTDLPNAMLIGESKKHASRVMAIEIQ